MELEEKITLLDSRVQKLENWVEEQEAKKRELETELKKWEAELKAEFQRSREKAEKVNKWLREKINELISRDSFDELQKQLDKDLQKWVAERSLKL